MRELPFLPCLFLLYFSLTLICTNTFTAAQDASTRQTVSNVSSTLNNTRLGNVSTSQTVPNVIPTLSNSIGNVSTSQQVPQALSTMSTLVGNQSSTSQIPTPVATVNTVYGNCVEDFTESSDTFASPRTYGQYPNNTYCNWTITVPEGSVIYIRFFYFDIEDSPSCQKDFVEIYDGNRTNHTLLARFCGHEMPDTVVSHGNQMFILFNSDSTISYEGFRAIYTTEPCGSYLTGPTGAFTSPNYPKNYDDFIYCNWTITVPEGSAISLRFTTFKLEPGTSCSRYFYDRVEVYEGNNTDHNLITELCAWQTPDTIVSKGNQVYIVFKTNGSGRYPGFRAIYTTGLYTACGSNLNGTSGFITSPNYPRDYPDFAFCNWTISVPESYIVSLRFISFDLENDSLCAKDQLEVYDGNSSDNSLISRLCGQHSQNTIVSNGNQMYILFKSDDNNTDSGFSVVYTAQYVSTIPPPTTQAPRPSSSFDIGHHQMATSPGLFQPNTRSPFSVSCSLDSLGRDIDSVVSLVLTRQGLLNNYTEEVVASVTSFHPDAPTLAAEAAGGTVEGSVDNGKGQSFLNVQWAFPTLAEAGDYMCEANALNNRGHPVLSKVYASGSVNHTISISMTPEELIQSYEELQQDSIRLTHAYLNLTRANTVLLTYLFNTPLKDDNGTRYFLSRFKSLNAIDADRICMILLDGMLVEIDSPAEYSFLQQYLTINLELDETVLTGATDETTEGVWTNRNSNILVPVLDWGGNQPVPDRSKNCLALQRTTSGVHMTDITCSANSDANTVHFICEVNALYD